MGCGREDHGNARRCDGPVDEADRPAGRTRCGRAGVGLHDRAVLGHEAEDPGPQGGHGQAQLEAWAGDQIRVDGPDPVRAAVAQGAGRNSIGVRLTGMGRDGAEGLKEMREAGASTIAQDENTSVVWGMPGAAWQIGAVQSLHPLPQIAARIVELATERRESPQRRSQSG